MIPISSGVNPLFSATRLCTKSTITITSCGLKNEGESPSRISCPEYSELKSQRSPNLQLHRRGKESLCWAASSSSPKNSRFLALPEIPEFLYNTSPKEPPKALDGTDNSCLDEKLELLPPCPFRTTPTIVPRTNKITKTTAHTMMDRDNPGTLD